MLTLPQRPFRIVLSTLRNSAYYRHPRYTLDFLLAAMPACLSLSSSPSQCSVFTQCVYSLCRTEFVNFDYGNYFDSNMQVLCVIC